MSLRRPSASVAPKSFAACGASSRPVPSCRRQRKVYEETGDFREVVASLVGEVRARVIATKPCFVVADEPAGDLAFPYRPERVATGCRPVLLSDQSCDER